MVAGGAKRRIKPKLLNARSGFQQPSREMKTIKLPASLALVMVVLLCTSQLAAQTLQVKSVGSIRTQSGQTQVMVVFNKPLHAETAVDTDNYTFTGGITVTDASLITGLPSLSDAGIGENPAPTGRIQDNECVVLTVTGLNPGASATINIRDVMDADQNTITPTLRNFTDSGYTYVDVGVHPGPGKVIPIGTNGFDIFSNGQTQWAAHDQITVAYKEVTGDFNLVARVEFQDWSSRWARAGMVARETLNAGESATTQATTASRYVSIHANPVQCWTDAGGLAAGNNQFESHFRDTVAGQTASAAGGTPLYPNAWIRVSRTNDTLYTFRSDNGQDWTQMAERTVAGGWNNNLFVGPSFSPETGNVNAEYGPALQNRFYLAQIRFGAIISPRVTSFQGNPQGFIARIQDNVTAVVPGTLSVTHNDVAIPAAQLNVQKDGAITTVRWNSPSLLPQGSANVFVIEFNDTGTPPAEVSSVHTYVANYAIVPASYALAAPPTTPGLVVNRVYQSTIPRAPGDLNSTANAEMQVMGELRNSSGVPHPNTAEFTGPFNIGGDFSSDITWSQYVNWEQAAGNINETGVQPDNFNFEEPPGTQGQVEGAYANFFIPGVDLGAVSPPDPDHFVLETIAYVNLSQGLHRWGVNSDDGFKVSIAPGQPSPAGITLGEFDGGRGAADTLFDFVVETAGYYPVRLLYWEGTGGANCEWFSENIATGERILIGDTVYFPTTAYQVFRTGQGRAYIRKLVPSSGWTGTQPTGPIQVELQDGRTQVTEAKLYVDGAEVSTGTKTGQITTINYVPTTPWQAGTLHTGQVVYTESGQTSPITNNFTFVIRSATFEDLPADSFWIEAEDWDHGGGETVASASTMPYLGGAYNGLLSELNVDYSDVQNIGDAGIDFSYRGDRRPNHVNLTLHTGAGVLAIERPGGVTMTTNYRIGWSGSFWGNYTRNIPAGNYLGYAALSHGDGVATVMEADLDRVTAGVGTTTQTLERIGTFRGTGSGGWGSSVIVPLKAPSGADAIVTFPGGPVTLRVAARIGDFDWFVFAPTTELPPVDQPEFTNIQLNTDGSITVEWTGGGTLQAAPTVLGPWENVDGATSPYTFTPTSPALFGRIIIP
jgi:hypothetical protein